MKRAIDLLDGISFGSKADQHFYLDNLHASVVAKSENFSDTHYIPLFSVEG
jgi:hypothetical protein